MTQMTTLSPIIGHEIYGVSFGRFCSSKKVHICNRPMRDGIIGAASDSDTFCGRTSEGLSPYYTSLDDLAQVGWTGPEHICCNCLREVGAESILSAGHFSKREAQSKLTQLETIR